MRIRFRRLYLPKRYPLAISRGVSAGSENLFVEVEREGVVGLGELAGTNVPGGETCDTGVRQLEALVDGGIEDLSIQEIWVRAREQGVGPRALAALDMALWDAFARGCGQPLWRLFGLPRKGVPTSITVGINPAAVVREQAAEMLARTGCRFLKVKLGNPLGAEADREAFAAAREVAQAAGVALRVDANGGWELPVAETMLRWLADRGVEYVEQPLPQGSEGLLPRLFARRPLPIFVDESCHVAADVPGLAACVDGVNVKLMKCGGLTEALRLVATARAHRLATMIGCMGESSVAISAAAALGALFDHIDLDSHLNLAPDPARGAALVGGVVLPPDAPGHGACLTDADT
ncbi:MAG: dipeptide epimerase [Lentisphaeria bacterium]|nr:dipeptide epimerase [Lentisphaeria bacterium]